MILFQPLCGMQFSQDGWVSWVVMVDNQQLYLERPHTFGSLPLYPSYFGIFYTLGSFIPGDLIYLGGANTYGTFCSASLNKP